MTRRIISAVAGALRAPARHDEQVHFHQGADGAPAVCFDARCQSPHLEV